MFLKVIVIRAKRIMHWTLTGEGGTVQHAGYGAVHPQGITRGRKRVV